MVLLLLLLLLRQLTTTGASTAVDVLIRDYLCAVPTLEEAQIWVVALQWAASVRTLHTNNEEGEEPRQRSGGGGITTTTTITSAPMMPLSTTAADPHQHHHWWKVDYRTTLSTSSTITSSVQGITTAVHKANNVKTTATIGTDTSYMAATLADSDFKAIQSHRDSRMEHEMSGNNTNTITTATAAAG
jgi:hypothetical protein